MALRCHKWEQSPPKRGVSFILPIYRTASLKKKGCRLSLQQPFVLKSQLLLSVNGALTAILALALKTDGAVYQSEQGVILANANIDTGMDVSASLANQDIAGQNELTVSALDTQALRLGITAVLGGTAALMVSEEQIGRASCRERV